MRVAPFQPCFGIPGVPLLRPGPIAKKGLLSAGKPHVFVIEHEENRSLTGESLMAVRLHPSNHLCRLLASEL